MALALLILSLAGLAACLGWAVAPAAYGRVWLRAVDRLHNAPARRPIPRYVSPLRFEIEDYLRRREATL